MSWKANLSTKSFDAEGHLVISINFIKDKDTVNSTYVYTGNEGDLDFWLQEKVSQQIDKLNELSDVSQKLKPGDEIKYKKTLDLNKKEKHATT